MASQELVVPFDPKKLLELLELALGPLMAVGAIVAAVEGGAKWLTRKYQDNSGDRGN
jgi:hypothetical protein